MGLRAELEAEVERHWRLIEVAFGLSGGFSFFSYIWGLISKDVLIYIIIFLYFASLILIWINFSRQLKIDGGIITAKEESGDQKAKVANAEQEITEWAEICDGLRNYLTPDVEKWEVQKNGPNTATDSGRHIFNQRRILYDKASQKLREYKNKNHKN